MVETVAFYAGTLVVAKTLMASLVEIQGPLRIRIRLQYALYLAELAVLILVVAQAPLAVLRVALLFKLASFASRRFIGVINHQFLEFVVLLLLYRLWAQPATLVAVLQVVIVSVWVYSVFQKLFHGEYADGSFFYVFFGRRQATRLLRWSQLMVGARVSPGPALSGLASRIDPALLRVAQRFCVFVLAVELVLPLLALLSSGTVWAVALLLAVACSAGLIAWEVSFMVTNIVLAPLFLVQFDAAAFWQVNADPVATLVLVWLASWPVAHAVLARRLRFSSWLGWGWGMYATQKPSLLAILPSGDLADAQRLMVPHRTAWLWRDLVRGFGACRLRSLRDYTWAGFLRVTRRGALRAGVLRWYRIEGDRLVSRCAVWRPGAGSLAWFEVRDDASEREFAGYARDLAAAGTARPQETAGAGAS